MPYRPKRHCTVFKGSCNDQFDWSSKCPFDQSNESKGTRFRLSVRLMLDKNYQNFNDGHKTIIYQLIMQSVSHYMSFSQNEAICGDHVLFFSSETSMVCLFCICYLLSFLLWSVMGGVSREID